MLPKVSFQGPVSWKPQKSFRPAKAFSVYLHLKKEFVHVPKTPCTKRTSVQIKNLWIKHLCNRKVRDFVTVLWAQKVSGAFKKRAPGLFVWFFRKRWQNQPFNPTTASTCISSFNHNFAQPSFTTNLWANLPTWINFTATTNLSQVI